MTGCKGGRHSTQPGYDGPDGAPDELTALIDMLPANGLEQLMAESDFVVLALPLTPETTDLVNSELSEPCQAGLVDHQHRSRRARR